MAGYLEPRTRACSNRSRMAGTTPATSSSIEQDGFLRIRGRAKRFAKIGGEMVSLAAVEALAGELWPASLSAVAMVKDPRKGERLVLLTEAAQATRQDFLRYAKSRGIAELAVPSEVIVGKVPVLGSGKIDFVTVARCVDERRESLAAQFLQGQHVP